MKLKNVLLTLGLATTVAAAGVASFASMLEQQSIETNAETSEVTFYVDVRNSYWGTSRMDLVKVHIYGPTSHDVYIYDSGSGRSYIEVGGVQYVSFSIANNLDVTGFEVYYDEKTSLGNSTVWTSFSDFADGQNLIIVGSSGSWQKQQPVTLGTLTIGATVDVTKYGICDGHKNDKWVLGTDTVESGDTYPVPANETLSNYHFEGWFIDEDCETAYTATTISDDLDLYAKFTSFSKDSYIYYMNSDNNQTSDMFHTWGGEEEYATHNVSITSIAEEVQGVITFDGYTRKIYKIPFSSESGDNAFKFHADGDKGDWTYESSEYSLVSGSAYNWLEGYVLDNAAAGAAIDFLLDEEELRNSVEDWGDNSLDYSICGIDPSDAAGLYEKYLGLSARALQYVNNSYVKTYNDAPNYAGASEGNIKLDAIMEEILIIALRDTKFAEDHPTLGVSPIFFDSENSGLIIAVTAFAAILATGGFFFLRRRKEN